MTLSSLLYKFKYKVDPTHVPSVLIFFLLFLKTFIMFLTSSAFSIVFVSFVLLFSKTIYEVEFSSFTVF